MNSATGEGAESSSSKSARGLSSAKWLDIIKEVYNIIKKAINCSNMTGSSSSSSPKSAKDILTQLANILPTGTFLAFQLIAPLSTNNGNCGSTEKIVTGVLLGVFAFIIVISCFTDSVKVPITGTVYYGLVTSKGLWNPAFKGSGIPGANGAYYTSGGSKYTLRVFDFIIAALSLVAFAALSLLSDPVTSCYFKSLSKTVVKTVPLIVGVVVSFLLTFAPAARNGIGFRVDASSNNSSTTRSSLLLHEPAVSTAGP